MGALPTFQRFSYLGLEPALAFDVIYGGHFEHRLLSIKQAAMEHQRLAMDDLLLESGAYDFPVIARGAMPKGSVCIGMMAAGAKTTRCNTTAIGPDEIQIYAPGVDLLYHAKAESRWINFSIPENRLQEAVIARVGYPLALPNNDVKWVQLPRGRRSYLIRLVDDAFAIARTFDAKGMPAALAAGIAQELLGSYIEALGDATLTDRVRRGSVERHHSRLVLACEQLALSGDAVAMDMNEMASRCGYTRRSLELIFNRSVGMPPGRWFLNLRLNGVLRDLLTSTDACRIADVALRWGFRHPARFAEQYRRAFGELPSQTLGRRRS